MICRINNVFVISLSQRIHGVMHTDTAYDKTNEINDLNMYMCVCTLPVCLFNTSN